MEPSEPRTIHTHRNGDAAAAVLLLPGRKSNAMPNSGGRFARDSLCSRPLALKIPRPLREIPHALVATALARRVCRDDDLVIEADQLCDANRRERSSPT